VQRVLNGELPRIWKDVVALCAVVGLSLLAAYCLGDRWVRVSVRCRGGMILTGDSRGAATVTLCAHQNSHRLAWDRAQVSAVRGQRLTAWAMARPLKLEAWTQNLPEGTELNRDSCVRFAGLNPALPSASYSPDRNAALCQRSEHEHTVWGRLWSLCAVQTGRFGTTTWHTRSPGRHCFVNFLNRIHWFVHLNISL